MPLRRGQVDNCLAISTTAAFIVDGTFLTLDEQQVTAFITAIGMRIGGSAALMTSSDDLPADPLSHPVVKDKIFAPELVVQPLFPDCISIMNDPAFEMVDIREPLVQQPGAGFLTPDPSGAVHNDRVFLLVLQ